MPLPTVDIIIPTYKPDNTLGLLLQKLQEQTFVVHKVIIINTEQDLWENDVDDSKGNSFLADQIKRAPFPIQINHITKEEFDHGGTRRFGIGQSNSEFFICMTMDAVPADKYLVETLVNHLKNERVAAVCARQLPKKNCNEIERFTRGFNYPDTDQLKSKDDIGSMGIKAFFCSNVCSAYRRSIYEELSGFEQNAIFNEDMIYAGHAIKAGYFIGYATKACVIHSHNYTGKQQFHRNFDLAVSQKQHPEVFGGVKSESEGIRMVKQTAKHLLTIKKPWLIVDLVWKSGCKYLGYKTGLRFEQLSHNKILKYTMNKGYWLKMWEHNTKNP
ncbi:glycosyltransferase [Lachnospiraceae bacterium ZAX-1]